MNGNIPTLFVTAERFPKPGRRPCSSAGTRALRSRPSMTSRAIRRAATARCSGPSRTRSPSRRIHRAFPGGLEDLEIYRQEVVDGVHDHWIAPRKESGPTPTTSASSPTKPGDGRSTRSMISSKSSAGRGTRAAPRPSPGTSASTRRPTDPPCLPAGVVPDARRRDGRTRPQHEHPTGARATPTRRRT